MPIDYANESTRPRFRSLFERMPRVEEADRVEREPFDIPHFTNFTNDAAHDLVLVDVASAPTDGAVRFSRVDIDGVPGVVMQERREDGSWQDSWSLPTESIDAREGMMGWLNGQSHRWDRFARMLHRRGGDELTRWIFELMVVPSTAQARPPRFSPHPHVTIDHYVGHRPGNTHSVRHQNSRRLAVRDDCACRPGSLQNTRDY